MFKPLLLLAALSPACADLRMASQPKRDWKVQQRNRNVPFQQDYALYMEPSDFNYAGLKKQRDGGGYDNFLRSNIDNEQDRRNFNEEPGRDHLPFRSFETAKNDAGETTVKHKMQPASNAETGVTEAGNKIIAKPGEPYVVPLRWNNPHSSELEVNIWVFKNDKPYVIPIRKPACSGEGYQDNVFTFIVPSNFNSVASCRQVGECVLQVYAHSVESRMYASGTPLVVEGGTGAWNPPGGVKPAQKDVAFDLYKLRRLCLPSSLNEVHIKNAQVFEARLSSDVYNHAYQNSDFSPYAGQQPLAISQNLQASCILKMTVGNFGELGKEYMQREAREARSYANKLDKKARQLIRDYESSTNQIINSIKKLVANNDTIQVAPAPAGAVECKVWRDNYQRTVGGRERGKDRTGGFCAEGLTCLCRHDCWGERDGKPDAYCAELEPIEAGDTSGKQKVKVGTETNRIAFSAQKTEHCFRCAEVGSTSTNRINTNTYIPSFEIHGQDAVEKALMYIPPVKLQNGFLTNPKTGAISKMGDDVALLQIYMAVLTEMWDEFKSVSDGTYMAKHYPNARLVSDCWNKCNRKSGTCAQCPAGANGQPGKCCRLGWRGGDGDCAADEGNSKDYHSCTTDLPETALEKFKFHYRGPVLKTTTTTLSDANGGKDQQYRKRDEAGKNDKGYYSAKKAWGLQALDTGSSTAVPQTDGPLNSGRVPQTVNHADGKEFYANNVVYKLPPKPADSGTCIGAIAALDAEQQDFAITPEGEDMDGLNYDADCDDDAAIAKAQAAHDDACEAEAKRLVEEGLLVAEKDYECPPYPEPDCRIPGADAPLASQMFSNQGQIFQHSDLNAAPGVAPSAAAGLTLLAVVMMLM